MPRSDRVVWSETYVGAPRSVPRHPLVGLEYSPTAPAAGAVAVTCGACGTRAAQNSLALRCNSCGELMVQDAPPNQPARPDGVLPFAVDEIAARSAFTRWLGSRRFAPGGLRNTLPLSLDRIFLPHWSFSTTADCRYSGARGDTWAETTTHTHNGPDGQTETNTTTTTHTRWSPAAGHVSRTFEGMLTPACRAPIRRKIPQWPLHGVSPFGAADVRAEDILAQDTVPEQAFQRTVPLIAKALGGDVRRDIGGHQQRVDSSTTTYSNTGYSLLLLPAWLGSYAHGDQIFAVLINGVTGNLAGERPYSWAKVFGPIAGLAVAIAVLMLLFGH